MLDDEEAATALWSPVGQQPSSQPQVAAAVNKPGSFPSDLHSQMGLASAMVAMQVTIKEGGVIGGHHL